MNKSEYPGRSQRRAGAGSASVDSDIVILHALRFFADEPEQAQRFFVWSGLDSGSLRQAATRAGFGDALIDYFGQDEAVLLSFARHAGLDPAKIAEVSETRRAGESWNGGDP